MIADMHTHSVNSHDSVCEIEDMCLMQIKRGTNIFAVTDHCDVFSYKDYDIYILRLEIRRIQSKHLMKNTAKNALFYPALK